MDWRDFFASKAGKRALIIIGAVVIIAIIVIIMIIQSRVPTVGDIETDYVDPISGETIRILDQEPEEDNSRTHLVGFGIFGKVGFTAQQQEIIFNTVQSFFTDNYPDIERLSYRQNSLSYDEDNEDLTYFDLVSNTGIQFKVRIDIQSSFFKAEISIYDNTGHQIN